MIRITTCPMCEKQHEVDVEAESTRCQCGHFYYLDDDDRCADDPDPD